MMQKTLIEATRFTLFFMLCITVATAAAQTTPRESDIQASLESARQDRAFAADRLDKARQWRQLAANAKRNAQQSRSQADRNMWNRTAREHERNAANLEAEAANLEAQATRKEARAADMRRQLDEHNKAEERRAALRDLHTQQQANGEGSDSAASGDNIERPNITVDDVLGVWRRADNDAPYVIVQEDPDFDAYPHRLELHTLARVWKGNFTSFDEGDSRRPQSARVVFTHKPNAEEMNSEIPLWARQAVAGQLEWKIELNEVGSCDAPSLEGKFFPGEVTWREGANGSENIAWLSGQGEGREFTLTQSPGLAFDIVSRPMLRIRLPGQELIGGDSVQTLIKGQKFFVEAIIPKEKAQEIGPETTVELRGMTGNDTYSLTMKAAASGDRPVVIYTHAGAAGIVIGDADDMLMQGRYDANPLSLNPGIVLDFSVSNGERVQFDMAGARRSVRVFDNNTLAVIQRYKEGLEEFRILLNKKVSDNTVPPAERRDAQRKGVMVNNAQVLMEATDALMPPQIAAVGSVYLGEDGKGGMLRMALGPGMTYRDDPLGAENNRTFAWFTPQTPDHERRARAAPDVFFMSNYERFSVIDAINKAKPDIAALYVDMLTGLAKATYFLTTNYPGACTAGAYTLLTNRDVMDQKVDVYTQRAAAAEVLLCLGPAVLSGLNTAYRVFATGGKARGAAQAAAGLAVNKLGAASAIREEVVAETSATTLPPSLSQRKLDSIGISPPQTQTRAPDPTIRSGTPISCVPRPATPRPQPVFSSTPGSTAHLGPNARIETSYGEFPQYRQVMDNSCQLQSQNFLRGKSTGQFRSEAEGLKQLREHDIYVPYKRNGSRWGPGLDDNQAAIAAYLGGGTASKPKPLTLEQMAAAQAHGWGVKNVLHLGRGTGRESLHAVALVRMTRNAKGQIQRVYFFDPEVGFVVSLPACDYKNLLSEAHIWPNSQGFKWSGVQ